MALIPIEIPDNMIVGKTKLITFDQQDADSKGNSSDQEEQESDNSSKLEEFE